MQVHDGNDNHPVSFDSKQKPVRKALERNAPNRPAIKSMTEWRAPDGVGRVVHFIQKICTKSILLFVVIFSRCKHFLLGLMFQNYAHLPNFFRASRMASFASRQVVLPDLTFARRRCAVVFHSASNAGVVTSSSKLTSKRCAISARDLRGRLNTSMQILWAVMLTKLF